MPRSPNLTPELQEQMFAKMRTGRYRKGTVFAMFGFCPQACYMRESRARKAREAGEESDDFDLQVEQAMRIGEATITDLMFEAMEKGRDWRGYERILHNVHGICGPLDEQRIAESRAQTEAIKRAASPEGRNLYRDIVAEMMGRRPAAARPAESKPEAADAG
jgi:hypothetical protein